MLVTSLECSEMVTSDLPRSQDLTLSVLSWLKGLIWGQASTGGGVHECVYKVCIHMPMCMCVYTCTHVIMYMCTCKHMPVCIQKHSFPICRAGIETQT